MDSLPRLDRKSLKMYIRQKELWQNIITKNSRTSYCSKPTTASTQRNKRILCPDQIGLPTRSVPTMAYYRVAVLRIRKSDRDVM